MSTDFGIDAARLDDGTHVVTATGDIDTQSAPQLSASLDRIMASGGRHVVIDLSGVRFIDSSGLVALVTGSNRLRKAAGDLRIAAPSEPVLRLLNLTRMDAVFGIFPTREAALGSV
jgi:anti-sigma B factor antagonist